MERDKQPQNAPNRTGNILLGASKAKFEGCLHGITKASYKFIGFCKIQNYSSLLVLTLKKVAGIYPWLSYRGFSPWLQRDHQDPISMNVFFSDLLDFN